MNQTNKHHLLAILFLGFFVTAFKDSVRAEKDCNLEDVTLKQTFLGKDRDNYDVYNVTLTNQCHCKVVDLLLSCDKGFKPHSIDPADILTQNARTCRVNRDMEPGKSVSFVYTAKKMWPDLEVVLVGCIG